MTFTVNRTIRLVEEICCACDLTFAVPDYWQAERKRKGDTFYCPAGHGQRYGEGENARLRRQLKSAQARAKKRVGNGVCPCCHRSFQNLGRHMASQHPDFADDGGAR